MDADQVNRQIFMVGTGGQGILLLARALSEIAVKTGQRVIASETHGMAMRGGTVTANLKIGSFASPLIPAGSADLLIGLDETEAKGYLHMLKEGGISAVNAAEKGPFDHVIDATAMALNVKMPGAVNMIMLGFTVKILGIDLGEVRQVVEAISPKRGMKDNLKAMEMGYAYRHQGSA
jgi:indolepyruvate ferredoxin oxidoreductase beta subunit